MVKLINNGGLVEQTTQLSVIIQIITGIIGTLGLFLPIKPQDIVLKEILTVEMIVQYIEFAFYLWFLSDFNLKSLGESRYYDWVFTTPLMLITAVILFSYENAKMKKEKPTQFLEFLQKNTLDVSLIVIYNFLMLFFGYLGEIGLMNKYLATLLGFVFFALSFNIIYKYAKTTPEGRTLFLILLILWAVYGVVYLFPAIEMNISYNILDIIAKNFFGLYLVYRIYTTGAD